MQRKDDSGFDPPPTALGIAIFYYLHKYKITMQYMGRCCLTRRKSLSIVKEMVVRDQIEDLQHRNEMINYLY